MISIPARSAIVVPDVAAALALRLALKGRCFRAKPTMLIITEALVLREDRVISHEGTKARREEA